MFSIKTKETIRDSTKGYRYRFIGDNRSHEIYDPAVPNDLTYIITSLNFSSDHPIRFSWRRIGQSGWEETIYLRKWLNTNQMITK